MSHYAFSHSKSFKYLSHLGWCYFVTVFDYPEYWIISCYVRVFFHQILKPYNKKYKLCVSIKLHGFLLHTKVFFLYLCFMFFTLTLGIRSLWFWRVWMIPAPPYLLLTFLRLDPARFDPPSMHIWSMLLLGGNLSHDRDSGHSLSDMVTGFSWVDRLTQN